VQIRSVTMGMAKKMAEKIDRTYQKADN